MEDEDLPSCDGCGEPSGDLEDVGDVALCEGCRDADDYEDQVRGDYRSMQL